MSFLTQWIECEQADQGIGSIGEGTTLFQRIDILLHKGSHTLLDSFTFDKQPVFELWASRQMQAVHEWPSIQQHCRCPIAFIATGSQALELVEINQELLIGGKAHIAAISLKQPGQQRTKPVERPTQVGTAPLFGHVGPEQAKQCRTRHRPTCCGKVAKQRQRLTRIDLERFIVSINLNWPKQP